MISNERKWNINWTISMIIVMVLSAMVAMTIGRYTISIKEILAVVFPKMFTHVEVLKTMNTVILNVRMPRVLLSMLAGAGLGISGAAFQSLFANPLATPDTLGVATGASFGAALGILMGFSGLGIQMTALLAGIAAVTLVCSISRINGKSNILMIILSGIVISALFSAMVSLIKYVADPQDILPSITYWLMGSMSSTTKETLMLGSPFIIIGIVLIFLVRWKLNVMSLPEDEAKSLGINVKLVRGITILGATMVTASVVSMCGLIGWVGLLIPHIARMIFGNNNQAVVPASICFGAIFMLCIDTIARSVTAAEIPVSILTAVIGAPFFIILLRKTGGIKS
ncbi:MAG: iron ABC transporter permease [Peptostreptococcaceae bacterium]|nr:iron ABC transporter permease [Peptostreptococcaceae bacterium]